MINKYMSPCQYPGTILTHSKRQHYRKTKESEVETQLMHVIVHAPPSFTTRRLSPPASEMDSYSHLSSSQQPQENTT
jgi:hypothetical protein